MRIQHRNGSYEVKFESLESALDGLPENLRIVTDANIVDAFGPLLEGIGRSVIIDPGEKSKSTQSYTEILSWLAQTRASRKTTLCALGGGVVGDLGGFAAATYMRGIPFIQIPTSLLAQVDSSVGGKVGIDLPEGKNLAGAFYPPVKVSIPIDALARLPERQFHNGMAEVWKYGFIMDRDLVATLERANLHAEHEDLPSVVARCIELKAQVVEADEFETNGLRAILNFGHTIGHAVEFATGYESVLHGEAVSIGMVAEARLGENLGITASGTADAIERLLAAQGLPTTHPVLKDEERLIEAMYGDKKATEGLLAFSLLTEIGQCKLVQGVEENAVAVALRTS